MIIFIKRKYFSRQVDDERKNEDQYKELEMIWATKQKKEKYLISFEDKNAKKRNKVNLNVLDETDE